MDITPIVRRVFIKNDFVVLPGFGAFVSKYDPAEIDKVKNIFLPPKQTITFNEKLKHDDEALLVDAVLHENKLDKGEAENIVKDYVTDLNERLKKKEKIQFPGIGVLTGEEDGTIKFQSKDDQKIIGDNYGLSSFRSYPVSEQKQSSKKPAQKSTGKPVAKPSSGKKPVWPYVVSGAAALLIIGGIIIFYPDLFNKEAEKVTKEKKVSSVTEQKKAHEEKIEQVLKEKTKKERALVPEDKYAKYSGFAVVVGSFTSRHNAEKMKKTMASNGYQPEIIHNDDYYRVSLFTFEDRSKALEKYNMLRNKRGTEAVWIYNIE